MVEEFILTWDQLQPIIYTVIALSAFLIFVRWRWSYMRLMTKDVNKKVKREKTIEGIVERKLNEIPGMLKAVNEEIKHLEKTHATEDQMKSLKDKRRLLELGQDYGEIAVEIGMPFVKTMIKAIKGIG